MVWKAARTKHPTAILEWEVFSVVLIVKHCGNLNPGHDKERTWLETT